MIVVHVGFAKTGTTAFQNALFRHRDRLRDAGVLVPFNDEHEAHTLAARLLTGEISRRQDVVALKAMSLGDWLGNLDQRKVNVISSEYFEYCDAASLKGYFSTYDTDVRIVFVARGQGDLLLSGYFQDVAHQQAQYRIHQPPILAHHDFARRYQDYVAMFGAGAVICEWYENLAAARRSLLAFVLERLGIAVPPEVLGDVTRSNVSAADELADLLRYCNEAGLARCKALLVDGAFKFPAQFGARRSSVAAALVAPYVLSNIAFSAAAGIACPETARVESPAQSLKQPMWPPRLDGHENIYAMLHAMETQLEALERGASLAAD